MSLADIFRPRLSTGALLAVALPLVVTAAATTALVVVVVRREDKLRDLMTAATDSLKAGIAADAAVTAVTDRLHEALERIGADIAPVAHLARNWKGARQTAGPDKPNTEPAPPVEAQNHAPEGGHPS